MKQALYRKYRPMTFTDVCGQEHITKILRSQIASGSPSHAYLFTGSRGTGKTSSAKIMSRAVNCTDLKDGNPCCECFNCTSIASGLNVDVIEIDAASNNSVAAVRELCEEVNYLPTTCKYKVYIIDEVHMLTKDAFNALLKTLEEPPAHIIFILATTEVHEVPATILSRCQRFDFNRAPADVIAERIRYVSECEGMTIEPDAAMLIAKLADGGFRDALSLLDICGSNGDTITVQTVTQAAGLTGREELFELDAAIRAKDITALLKQVAQMYEHSCDMMRLCTDLTEYYRNIMVAKAVDDPSELINESPDRIAQICEAAKQTRFDFAARASDLLGECIKLMKQGKNKRVTMETTLIKMCMSDEPTAGGSTVNNAEIETLRQRVSELESTVNDLKKSTVKRSTAENKPAQVRREPKQPTVTREKIDYERAKQLDCWPEIIETIKEKSMLVATVLGESTAYVVDDFLLLDVRNPDFASMMNNDARHRETIKTSVQAVTGKKLRLAPWKTDEKSVKPEKIDKFAEENPETVTQ